MNQPDLRQLILDCEGHALVLGGPGSGKTTIALRKAVKRIKGGLRPGQRVLFLSFSRAAVARIADAASVEASEPERSQLLIQTFHSFFWDVLRANAYLLGAPKKLKILLPQDEKAMSGGIDKDDDGWKEWDAERHRLFHNEGRVAFDLFAPAAADLIERSALLREAIASRYPLFIVDEAQDTGLHAWNCVKLLAPLTQVICLADLDQQLFDYLPGVGPERIAEIRLALQPQEVDFGAENHRSPGTQILEFGDDVMHNRVRAQPYKGVSCIGYRPKDVNWNHLLRRALAAIYKTVKDQTGKRAETIAIIASNNRTALRLSNALNALGSFAEKGKAVSHRLMFDEAEALLCARLAAFLLQPKSSEQVDSDIATAIEMLARAKSATGQGHKAVAKLREQAAKIRQGKSLSINIAKAFRAVLEALHAAPFSGDPGKDWTRVKHALRDSAQAELTRAASQLDYIVALRRGHRISTALADEWLRDGAYTNAIEALDAAFAQEQLLDGIDAPTGIHIMNVHKAKGKQFDGVIVVRESRPSRNGFESSFVWRDDTVPYAKSRRIVRVAITRAQHHALILDPMWPRCPIVGTHRLARS
ncbi:UvrD-helicase domain-containing protein [Paraburkholderia sp. SUR17]|uniref:UvrD-helicase domain-containing protein n=1 Tax=Paraburkholderia sp. SUR17 TaxID=3034358 RepID=UPI002408120B|nr:UvrD-helicase domain-containing protein [Paraburkholderia sp. SUR17]WEY40076.1 UvrD-helicase domain-containing protein [Paraburkholderia sp. SUR17]